VAFGNVREEVEWDLMYHRGMRVFWNWGSHVRLFVIGGEVPRLVAVQGDVDEDGRQLYTSCPLSKLTK
jgi:hypothetical protein